MTKYNLLNSASFLTKLNRYLLVGFSLMILLFIGQSGAVSNFEIQTAQAGLLCNGVWREDLPDTPQQKAACSSGSASSSSSSSSTQIDSNARNLPSGARCNRDNQCASGDCRTGGAPEGTCASTSSSTGTNLPNGAACTTDNQCQSGNCCAGPTCNPRGVCAAGGSSGAVAGSTAATGNVNVNCTAGQTVQGPNGTIVVCSTSNANAAANASIGNVTASGGSATASNTATGGTGGGGGTASANNTATGGAGGSSTNTNTSTGGSSSVSSSGNSSNTQLAAASQGSTPSTVNVVIGPTPTPQAIKVVTAQVGAQPNVVAVAGAKASQLPATGLPEAALGLLSFLPLGYKFRKFKVEKAGLSANAPHLIWQQRQFHK